jgi:hypothetical protein
VVIVLAHIQDHSSPFPKLHLVPGSHYTFTRLVDCIKTKKFYDKNIIQDCIGTKFYN